MGISPLKTAVFLDRDGVLNHAVVRDGKPYPPGTIEELKIVDGAKEALTLLHETGFLLVLVTNQPDVARGTQSRETVDAMHAYLRERLPLDDVFTCFEDGDAPCKKPNPGMLLEARDRYGIDLSRSFMIGDRWRDIDAGHAAGCRCVLIDYGYDERAPKREPEARVKSLESAVRWILDHA